MISTTAGALGIPGTLGKFISVNESAAITKADKATVPT